MAKAKTTTTDANVQEHLASRGTEQQIADCQVLMQLMHELTGEPARMWGPSIVGHGRYRYRYASGTTGESCRTGFAIRGKELVVYLPAEGEAQAELLSRLGPHKLGKACLYLKRLQDVDLGTLKALIAGSLAELQRRHPDPA